MSETSQPPLLIFSLSHAGRRSAFLGSFQQLAVWWLIFPRFHTCWSFGYGFHCLRRYLSGDIPSSGVQSCNKSNTLLVNYRCYRWVYPTIVFLSTVLDNTRSRSRITAAAADRYSEGTERMIAATTFWLGIVMYRSDSLDLPVG
jgi:hypothetical protein